MLGGSSILNHGVYIVKYVFILLLFNMYLFQLINTTLEQVFGPTGFSLFPSQMERVFAVAYFSFKNCVVESCL